MQPSLRVRTGRHPDAPLLGRPRRRVAAPVLGREVELGGVDALVRRAVRHHRQRARGGERRPELGEAVAERAAGRRAASASPPDADEYAPRAATAATRGAARPRSPARGRPPTSAAACALRLRRNSHLLHRGPPALTATWHFLGRRARPEGAGGGSPRGGERGAERGGEGGGARGGRHCGKEIRNSFLSDLATRTRKMRRAPSPPSRSRHRAARTTRLRSAGSTATGALRHPRRRDTWGAHTLMVAIGCPLLQNDAATAAAVRARAHRADERGRGAPARISGAGGVPATQPFVKSNSPSMRTVTPIASLACRWTQVLQCRLGANWRYCSVLNNPNLAGALTSGCGDPYGPCKFGARRSTPDARRCSTAPTPTGCR